MRRIHGSVRAGPGDEGDAAFRLRTRTPSLDCVLCRARLAYVARLLRAGPPALTAPLRQGPQQRRSPWFHRVVDDFRLLRRLVARCAPLPDPDADPERWREYIASDALRWKQDVGMLFFTDSVCDADAPRAGEAIARPFACHDCGTAFATAKQYAQHRRAKHGERCPQRAFACVGGVPGVRNYLRYPPGPLQSPV